MLRTLLAATLMLSLQTARAASVEDQIRQMAGCHEVTFEFTETFDRVPNNSFHSPKYFEKAYELVVLDKDEAGEVHLQHILPAGNGALKHWRQEWTKEAKTLWTFQGGLRWTRADVTPNAGAWLLRVNQVDDSPRYECQANWVTTGQKTFWECDTASPLPRREFSKRSDYDILQRTSRFYLTKDGWTQEEDNKKFQSATGLVLAEEKGFETSRRVDARQCGNAQAWWNARRTVWNMIQDEWRQILNEKAELKLRADVGGKTLTMALNGFAEKNKSATVTAELRSELRALITQYIE